MADLCADVHDFDMLETAFRSAFMYSGELTYDIEEWLIILHNHLIWGSYIPGDDPVADIVIHLLNNKEPQ